MFFSLAYRMTAGARDDLGIKKSPEKLLSRGRSQLRTLRVLTHIILTGLRRNNVNTC